MLTIRLPKPFALKLFLAIVLLEIFLGGGGRLFEVGALSIRMYLFVFALIVAFIIVGFQNSLDKNYVILISTFTLVTTLASIVGFINGAPASMVFNDIKPLLAFFSLLFFGVVIRSINDINLVVRLIKFSAIILALAYLTLFVLINAHLISFPVLYARFSETNEFFFRGEFAFFYKGFLYICIGLCFYYVHAGKPNRMVIAILLSALVLTFTRGFLLSIVLAYFFYVAVIQKKGTKLILFLMLLGAILYFSWEFINNSKKIDRDVSNSERLTQIREVGDAVTVYSVIFGHGFGIGVPSRQDRMEIAFLEIFHKQGLIGLFFWGLLLYVIWRLYERAKLRNPTLATQFVLAAILVYFQSFTNPYVNNPIGLSMVILSIVCLNVLSKTSIPVRAADAEN